MALLKTAGIRNSSCLKTAEIPILQLVIYVYENAVAQALASSGNKLFLLHLARREQACLRGGLFVVAWN